MEPRFIHKSSVGLSQRQLAALFTDKVESRICARPFVRKPRAPRSIRSHSRNKMLEPAIIEASMNLDIEHILSDSEEEKNICISQSQHQYLFDIFMAIFFPNLKQRLYAKWRTEKRQFSAPFFAQLLKKKQAFFCVRLSKKQNMQYICVVLQKDTGIVRKQAIGKLIISLYLDYVSIGRSIYIILHT